MLGGGGGWCAGKRGKSGVSMLSTLSAAGLGSVEAQGCVSLVCIQKYFEFSQSQYK